MSFPFITISDNVSSLNSGSYYAQNDLGVFNLSQSADTFFGNSSQDVIEFATYDITGNLNSWDTISKTDTYSVFSKTYKDVDQNSISYTYYKYNPAYQISQNGEILLNTLADLNKAGIQSGSQVISYNFLRNVAGNSAYPLIIKSVSVDRKEIQLIPTFSVDATNQQNVLVNSEFIGFSTKTLLINNLISAIVGRLSTFNVNDYYSQFVKTNPETVSTIKSLFGFSSDAAIIQFLSDVYAGYSTTVMSNGTLINKTYDGIVTYITNWLYTNYTALASVSELQKQFKYIIDTSAAFNLSKFNHNYITLDTSGAVNKFIDAIYYDTFMFKILDDVVKQYTDKYFSYLKNALNFGKNQFNPILNHSFITGSNNNTILVVKLLDYLPQNISLRDTCWVANIAMNQMIQKVILTQPTTKVKYKIAGPNFNVNPKIKDKPTTKSVNYINKSQLTNSNFQNQIEFNKTLNSLNVDYSTFSNFILFSSAQLRVKLFSNKLSQLTALSASLSAIQNNVPTNAFISASYSYDVNAINSQMTSIYQSFDGYESYLYSTPELISGSSYQTYLNSAIEYDFQNRDSLVNNTPEYINSDDANSDYLVFLSMVGHFFDNIYLYIQNFPTTQYLNNASSNSFVSTIANNLLEQFGWHPISSVENSSLETFYIGNTQCSGSQTMPQKTKMNIIWNRLLNNLPMIYKTKGTEESIRLLANVYGIPYSILNIKEFGGNAISSQDDSSYSFDNRYFLTRYSGSNEYVVLPYTQNIQSIEFKFAFDSSHTYIENDRVYLAYKDSNFNVFIDKTQSEAMGTLSFQLYDQFLTTPALPLFNGNVFNILIQKQSADGNYSGQIPSAYHIEVNSIDNDRIIFRGSDNTLLNSSYESYFSNGTTIEFGNIPNGNNNFFGIIDKINLWNTVLAHDAFLDHCKNFDAYDDYDVANTYTNLYFRYGVDYPINLATASAVIVNQNSTYNTTASVHNFPHTSLIYDASNCTYSNGSTYPYQFNEVTLTQNITLSNFGPNKFKNSKINKVTQVALARLMPTELSTTPIETLNNSNLVAAYVSPFSTRDADMLNFVGNYDMMDIIGDPSYLYSASYSGLSQLRTDYNGQNVAEPVLYQEFFTVYKSYIDSSFFDSVKQLIPARSKLIVGTLIEQSILERNKYQNQPVQAQILNIIDISPKAPLYTISSAAISVFTSSLAASVQSTGVSDNSLIPTKYISDDVASKRLSVLSINGAYFHYNGNNYGAEYVFKNEKLEYYPNYTPLNSAFTYATGSKYEYNFTANPSYFQTSTQDIALYPVGHYSRTRRGIGQSFTTTSANTVDSSGSLDGSSPIQLVAVNKNPSIKKLVSI